MSRYKKSDRELGLDQGITRRDFLQGLALGVSGALAGGTAAYPPTLTGLRGSQPGASDTGHALRDGRRWSRSIDTFERYDLVVVGGGISGLAAAHFYLGRRPGARVLILDNHDDFGGHARRNEFWLDGRMQLMNGGTYSIESPTPYSAIADGLLQTLGIDRKSLQTTLENKTFYSSEGLRSAVFFDRESFGADYLMPTPDGAPIGAALAGAPLSAAVTRDIERLEEGSVDYLPGMDSDTKKARLASLSYQQFLLTMAKVDAGVCEYYRNATHGLWGVGIDAVSALDCWGVGFPGFAGMQLKPGSTARMGYTPAGVADHGWTPVVHFPDGNATIARSLVRRLVPAAISGSNLPGLITAKADYGRLDRHGAPVRIRLNSTAINASNVGTVAASSGVEVSYVRDGAAYRVRGRHCVLACWNMIIPYLCPDLPERQKTALHATSKVPLLYTSVAVRNWSAFKRLGVNRIRAPGGYFSDLRLNESTQIGDYRTSRNPKEPTLLHMTRTPCVPNLPEREQNKAGRAEILATPFETYEREIRGQLRRILGPGGFDPARDIMAITVNRWPHGYAHEHNALFDGDLPEAQRPHVIGRAAFGNIVIANSDAAAAAYTDAAIDQAYRAIQELQTG